MIKLKIKRNDEVVVITGKDNKKRGKVLKILPKCNKVVVEGVNVVVKQVKPKNHLEGGSTLRKELPVHISNVALVDPKTKQPTKIKFKVLDDGKKVRVAKKSGEVV